MNIKQIQKLFFNKWHPRKVLQLEEATDEEKLKFINDLIEQEKFQKKIDEAKIEVKKRFDELRRLAQMVCDHQAYLSEANVRLAEDLAHKVRDYTEAYKKYKSIKG